MATGQWHGEKCDVLDVLGQAGTRVAAANQAPLRGVDKLRGLRGLNNEQPTTTATRHPPWPRPPACRSRRAAQPHDSPRNSPRSSPRARCCYTTSVVHHTPAPDLRQRDATTLWLRLEEQDEGASREPSVSHALTHRQASADLSTSSTSSASAEPAAAVAHGLQVVAEGTNPTVEYASRYPVACSQLTRLQHRRRPRPERTPREDMDGKRRRQLAARPSRARPAQRAHT
jgi:hypothetical protein